MCKWEQWASLIFVWEHGMSKTRFGSTIGLALAPLNGLFRSKLERGLTVEQKNLIEVVDFGLDLVQLGVDVAADKKVDMADLGLLLSRAPLLIGEGVAAVEGASLIPQELSAMKEEDAAAVVAHVVAKLAVDDAKAKLIVEKSLKAAFAAYELGKAIAS